MEINCVKSDEDDGKNYKNNLPAFRGISSVKNNKDVSSIDKTQEADAKRQNALAEKWKILQNQKCTIANALKGESFNKKIKFNEDGDQQQHKGSVIQPTKQKMLLFDDDDTSDHEKQGMLVSDFKLKLSFEGEKGKKLFHMQTTKATGDSRFVMDKRFFEEQETNEKMSDDEIEKQMNILEDVVGHSITKLKKKNENQTFNMVRYDPTQEEHKKYLKDKPDLPKQKRPKKPKVEHQKVIVEPVIDTDKYYKVGDKLKDVFSTQNQFSLTSLFNTSDKYNNCNKKDQDIYQAEKITKPLTKFGRNPFIDDSSDSEIEESNFEDKEKNVDTNIDNVPSGKIIGSRGLWREVFFFKMDDSRFKDAEEFYDPQYNRVNYMGSQDPKFIKKRDFLRDFIKNKNNRHKRNISKKLFSKKLGGTHNNRQKMSKNKAESSMKTKQKKKQNVNNTK